MGKALFGTHVTPASLQLADEVRSLRQRVAELEAALAAAQAARDDAVGASSPSEVALDDREPATT